MTFSSDQPCDHLARALSIFRDVLREIFDEAAYARFLRRRQMPSSTNAYSEFLSEQAVIHSRRKRCC